MRQIKHIPEDFVVKEISNVAVKDKGRYFYYRLKKKNRNTLDVVRELSRQLNIPEKNIGFAGSKDKHAVTEQVISLPVKKEVSIDNVSLEFLGQGDEPVSLGDLEGNKFEIVVRNLDNVEVKDINFIENYFDEQRFSENNVEIGKSLVKKDFKKAAELIEDKGLKEHLSKYQNDYIGALKKLPLRLLKMYVHAYQSFLWNETVSKLLQGREVEYSLGKFVFADEKKEMEIPLIGFATELKEEKEIISRIMRKESLNFSDFVIKQIPELSMEGSLRKIGVDVKDFSHSTDEDEFNEGKKKVVLKFSLPKGSYATMVVRKIFG